MNKYFYHTLVFFLSQQVFAQENNYIHYDTRDGLAGSTVYHICQDKKGYLWFATDNGISRFDGKRFKNFTSENALPDNEVLFIDSDSRGRVWITPFNKTICYYYEGRIHNNKNDSSLKNFRFSSFSIMSGENNQGDVYIQNTEGIFLYKRSGQLKLVANYKELASRYSLKAEDFQPANFKGRYSHDMVIYNRHYVFYNTNDSFVFLKKIKTDAQILQNISFVGPDLEFYPYKHPPPETFTTITSLQNGLALYNTLNGSWLIDSNGIVDHKPFLAGKKVSHAMRDNEGNTWFSTIGEGVYRLTSNSMKTFSTGHEFFCVEKVNGKIYAGTATGRLQVIKDLKLEADYPFQQTSGKDISARLYTMKSDAAGTIYLGFDSYLSKLNHGRQITSAIRPIKSIDMVDDNTIVVCTNGFTMKVRSTDLKVTDTIFRERGTKVIYDKGSYYIGTLNGLVIVDSNKVVTRVGENNSLLSKRIVDMCRMPGGGLWIATNDNGILLYKDGKVNTVINMQNGLTSSLCRSLFLKDDNLWIGTNKGINKINIHTKKVLETYSTSDGLASDIINAIYTEDSLIWVCSPAGLTYFSEKDISDSSVCLLDLNAINISGKEAALRDDFILSYRNNNISFDYTAISFKSAGEIIYKYKLTGLDKSWKETRLTTLSYPSLPPGNYEFELYAVNKFGKESNIVGIKFLVKGPIWKTLWFWLTILVLCAGLVWFLLRNRYKTLHEKLEEKNKIVKRMAELEQLSLRAQMNPHFVFNCLNSIQYFMLRNDIEQTNRYVTQLANLIRRTLDNSSKLNISIADELNYLTDYLELEQMRFSLKFRYDIEIDPEIDIAFTFIPAMMLQPFVENAIRHGIRLKKDEAGLIKIIARRQDKQIVFSIEDNGVGRETAARYKNEQHIEYQSKGMTLIQNRLEILNTGNAEKIKTEVVDLADDKDNATGTIVFIYFPLSLIENLN